MISKVVRDLREKKNINSKILAQQVGMNDTWISQIETGKIKHPKLPALKKLLRMLDCTEEQINEIILNEFPDVDKFPKAHSRNRTDYKMERRMLLTKRKNKDYSETELQNIKSKVLTEKQFKVKCQQDAHQVYCELKQLPKETVEHLVNLLIEDI